jgi:fumarylpyruvate hydrolase
MSAYLAPPTCLLATTGEALPVSGVLCIGRNYAAHAREMGATGREPPFHFLKSVAAVTTAPVVPYPPATADLHHEVELVVVIGRGGRDIAPADALDHVWGYALGLDMTRRDLQAEAKAAARPWSAAKDFDGAAIVGPVAPASEVGHPSTGRLTLTVNGAPRQSGELTDLIWSVPELIAALSALRTLHPGELVFTGTPAGVGAVHPGDVLVASFPGLPSLTVTVGAPR